MPRADYEFVPLTRDDFAMVRSWLEQPHIAGWWGSPDEELRLMEQDLGQGPTDMRIVRLDGHPFAYVQDYPAHHWHMPHYADFPPGTRAVDTFLGDPFYLGKGHASAYLRQRAGELLACGCSAVVIDPSPDNIRAVRAYRAAGFQGDRILPCEDGDPVIVMQFRG